MKSTLSIFACCVVTGACAQPVLTEAELTPPIGTWFTVREVDHVAPGPAVANFYFSVDGIGTLNTVTATNVLPYTTPFGANFPSVTYALSITVPSITEFSYASVDGSSVQEWGNQISDDQGVVYSNGKVTMHLPCAMGTTWTDTYSSASIDPDFPSSTNGAITGDYNGYGTLVLPFGTFTNVARVELQESATTTHPGGDPSTFTSNTVSYYIPGFFREIFQTTTSTSTYPGQSPFTNESSYMIDPTEVGIEESSGIGQHALLYPDPAQNAFSIAFTTPITGQTTITLMDAVGREVMPLDPSTFPADATMMTYDVSSVPRGMYIVRIMDGQGRSSNLPLILR